jgi:hypothetical protein
MRTGLVFIAESDAAGKERARTLVEVVGENDRGSSDSSALALQASSLCRAPQIHCDLKSGTILGVTEKMAWFGAARRECAKMPGCIFGVTLAKAGRAALEDFWRRRLGDSWQVEAAEDGLVLVKGLCPEGEQTKVRAAVNTLALGAIERGDMVFQCSRSTTPAMYVVKGQLLLMRDQDARDVGLAFSNEIWPLDRVPRLPGFKAFQDLRQTQVVAEPQLRVMAGVAGHVKSGTEYFLEGKAKDVKGTWRRAGLELKALVRPDLAGSVALSFEAQLSHAGSQDGRVMESNVLSSEVLLPLGEARLLGSVDSTLHLKGRRGLPFVTSWPLIGPWLRLFEDADGHSHLFLWLTVEEDKGGALVSPPNPSNDGRPFSW